MYREITQGIEVRSEPKFIPEQSRPDQAVYVFAYTITLTNHAQEPVKLLNRYWLITDGKGESHEVQGEGVIGQQPVLNPGESFTYSSFCPLPTPTGNMRGHYELINLKQESRFKVKIPLFFLRIDVGSA